MKELTLKILTPEQVTFEGKVSSLVAPGVKGLFGVWPDHAPMIARLKQGFLKVSGQGQVRSLPINEGFLEVDRNVVTVLST